MTTFNCIVIYLILRKTIWWITFLFSVTRRSIQQELPRHPMCVLNVTRLAILSTTVLMLLQSVPWVFTISYIFNCISDIMVSVLVLSMGDNWCKPRLCQTKDYDIGICCFSPKHWVFKGKSKDWLARN